MTELELKIRQEARYFVNNTDNLTTTSKTELLENIIKGFIIQSNGELLLNKYDFNMLLNDAKKSMATDILPTHIGSSKISQEEMRVLTIVKATINYLKSKNGLNREVVVEPSKN